MSDLDRIGLADGRLPAVRLEAVPVVRVEAVRAASSNPAQAPFSWPVLIGYWLGPVLIVLSHLGCLLIVWVGLSTGAMLWGLILYLVRMLATTSIYHRLLTHRSYRAPALFLWLGCIVAASAGQMGPSWWKAHHVAHHLHSDRAGDHHSPRLPQAGIKGFLYSQGGWLLTKQFMPDGLPADVEKDKVLKMIDRFHFIPTLALALLSWWIGGLDYLAAFFLSTTLLFHGVQTVNSFTHLWGDQPFQTADNSRNNAFVALVAFGEGWHNLHHAFQYSCRHGYSLRDGEVKEIPDVTFSFIRLLEVLHIASDIKLPSQRDLLQAAR